MSISKRNKKVDKELSPKEKNYRYIMIFSSILFFGILVVMFRMGNSSNKPNKRPGVQPTATGSIQIENKEGFESIEKNNYNYIYTFETESTKEMITGRKYSEKEKFTIINNEQMIEAAKLNEQYLLKTDGKYSFTTVPSPNLLLTDIKRLQTLISVSDYEEKKEYIKYEIDPVDMFDIYYEDFEYDPFAEYKNDYMEVYSKDGVINKIVIYLDNTISLISEAKTKTMKITLEYNDFGKVVDFELN